ncbi:hypothetical protein VVD49_18875 [Uliginosibacterium sp. H3]|uniref:Uncharacterized protein n=1 Tax=Uliginosibacterium silvisoli TaxID=3114758 RepID=A0ABU6K7M0_9RHOO|nr:hypothetical protein [Uliginosibacterium sp. H3]
MAIFRFELKPMVVSGVLLAVGMALCAAPASATTQSKQRQAARDVRQETRPDAREEKRDCRAADDKSNAGCRQDKRGAKQDGRQTARDIKY